jgi:hypothetical protein
VTRATRLPRGRAVVENSITVLDREAFEFLFAHQHGLVEMSRDRERQDLEYLPPEQAVARLGEFNYFGVVPRVRRRGRKQDVVDAVWSLWLDIDDAGGGDELRSLGAQGLLPTIILNSGRGWWGHWKLTEPVSKPKAEELNRRLVALVGRDAGADRCWGVQQIARLPGSQNERTGVIARVIELSRSDHEPSALDAMLPQLEDVEQPTAHVVKPLPVLPPLTDSALTVRLADLPLFLMQYCMQRPSWETAQQHGMDRSEVEWAIAKELLRRGLSEGQALRWFIAHRLPRHEQEAHKRRTFRWTQALIRSARCSLQQEMLLASAARPPSPLVEQTLHQPRRGYSKVDREAMLRLLDVISPVTYAELWRTLADTFGCSERAAKANIALGLEFGYLERTARVYSLTDRAHRQLARKGRPRGQEGMEWSAFIGDQPRRFLREQREADEWLRNLTATAAEN